ncbi:MAG TPA: hypothetical protein VK540_04840 [Polyangiaceae bacterium]|jgi:hypothetical protein|nr:hypothetical protein [Polyangiaceae bacterium]
MRHSQGSQSRSSEKLEDVAREVGARWGTRMRAHYLGSARTLGSWPGTLDEARRLIDDTVGATLEDDERELLALLAERGARRAWNDVTDGQPISTVLPITGLVINRSKA